MASPPALQCVSARVPGWNSCEACAAMRLHRSTSSRCNSRARSGVGSGRMRSSAQRKLTAVGRDEASTAAAASRSSPRVAASASAYPAATPIAGAPRTAMTRMASATSAADEQASSTTSPGSRRWSSRTTRGGGPSSNRMICSGSRAATSGGQSPVMARTPSYVPSSHDARYFACSSVSWSMSMSIVASFSRAISRSISSGTM